MKTTPYLESARVVKLSNPQHPFTPAHDVRVVIDAFSRVPEGNILDIGCNLGWTTREFALAFPDRLVYAVDWPPAGQTMSSRQRGEAPNWEQSCKMARDLPNVLSILADSRKLKSVWFDHVSCIFVDGDHSYAGVESDSLLASEIIAMSISKRSCIAWHDCYDNAPEWVGVKKYLETNVPEAVQVVDSWVALLNI